MTLEQVRRRYRISLIGIPIIMLSMLLTRYGAALNPYARLVGVFAVVTIGAAILWWGMRYGDMLDTHDAAVAAAKKHAQTCAENGESLTVEVNGGGSYATAETHGDDAA